MIPSGWTKTPNAIYAAMPNMSEAELKVTLVLVRYTYGRHTPACVVTYDDLMSATGMGRASVSKGLTAVLERGMFVRGNGRSDYAIAESSEFEPNTPPESSESELNTPPNSSECELNDTPNSSECELNDSPNSSDFELKTVQILNQNSSECEPFLINKEKEEEEKKEKGKEKGRPPKSPPKLTPAKLALAEMVNALAEVTLLDGHLNWPTLQKLAHDLMPAYTPEQIRQHYGSGQSPNGHWNWYLHDWRGQKNQPPQPDELRKTVKLAVAGFIPKPKADAEKAPPTTGLKQIAPGVY